MDRARARRGEATRRRRAREKCVVNNEREFLNGRSRPRGRGRRRRRGEGPREDRAGGRRGDGTRACGARRRESLARFGRACRGDRRLEWCFRRARASG